MNLSNLVTSSQSDTLSCSTVPPVYTGSAPRTRPQIFCETPSLASNSYSASKASSMPYSRAPQLPLSPPVEEQTKCSLPSISSLLEGADRSSSPRDAKRHRPNPPGDIHVHAEKRMRSHSYAPSTVNGSRNILPPTPPLRPDSGFHSSNHSPTGSSSSSSSAHMSNSTRNSSVSNADHSLQRRSSHLSLSPQSACPPFSQGPQSPYPGSIYPSPTMGSHKSSNEQRQLPHTVFFQPPPLNTNLPPNCVPVTITPGTHNPMISPGNPAWQHHHYFPPSNSTPYPQNHDRYICRTCHKAFSRPSSLRIHSHSHTGEKPFRCPHVGCGKAFSVRSNMKRHERGCHTGRAVAPVLA